MSLLDVVRSLRRFALVFLAILIATAGASYFVWTQVPVTYQSEASMVVLPPNQGTAGPDNSAVPINPYQNAGAQATQVAASALASISVSPEFQAKLAEAGVTSDVTVDVATGGGGVILALTAINARAAAAKADLTALADLVSLELRTRQLDSGAPESTLITADLLIVPNDAAELATDRTKVVAAVAIIGVIIALVAVVLLEILHRPRRKQTTAREDADEAESYDRIEGHGLSAAEPAVVAGSALAAIDEALALSEPDFATGLARAGEMAAREGIDLEATAPDLVPLPFDDDDDEDDDDGLPVSVGWPVIDDETAARTRSATWSDGGDIDHEDDDSADGDDGRSYVNGTALNGSHLHDTEADDTGFSDADDSEFSDAEGRDTSGGNAQDDPNGGSDDTDSGLAQGWPVREPVSVSSAGTHRTTNGEGAATRWSSPDSDLAPLQPAPTTASS